MRQNSVPLEAASDFGVWVAQAVHWSPTNGDKASGCTCPEVFTLHYYSPPGGGQQAVLGREVGIHVNMKRGESALQEPYPRSPVDSLEAQLSQRG